jgi:antitoxin component of MazEF toxin-antitoxin module
MIRTMVDLKKFIENKQLLVKEKKLQKLSNSLVLIIPKPWINALGWSQETKLNVLLNPGDNKIIISEIKVEEKENEETGELVIV